jgi:hypothetical protein
LIALCALSVDCATRVVSCRLIAASPRPHFSHSYWNCPHSALDRAPSPPRFSAGEKVAEGRMRGRFLSQRARMKAENATCHSTFHERTSLVDLSPPSSAFGTLRLAALAQGRLFSPRKRPGGRRRSIQGSSEFCKGVRNAASPHRGIRQRAKRNQPATRAAQSTREAQ